MQTTVPTEPGPTPPDALVLIGSQCPYCQSVLEALSRLVKDGILGRLTVVNVNALPQAPEARGIRSVPWTRIGPFELSGALSAAELRDWAEAAGASGGWGRYFIYLIEGGRLDALVERIRSTPGALTDLLQLFADPDTPLSVRIGISAAIEALSGTEPLRQAVSQILPLTLSQSPQIRADSCYFLGLAGDPSVSPSVRRLLEDEHPEVREVAA
jgi:hypothetical protein